MNNEYIELKKNTALIAISNIGSRVILFILSPLYSHYMSTSQYGTMDIITTTVSLLGPIFCLDIYEATFRYASEKNYDENKLYSSSLAVCIVGLLLTVLGSFIALLFGSSWKYITSTLLFTLLTAINSILTQFARGKGEMKVFVFSGILNAIILLISNLLFLIALRKQLTGWAISYLLAKLVTFLYLAFRTKMTARFKLSLIDKQLIKELLSYCIPLLPTALLWWIMNVSDRYMLAFFAGTAITGIYAVAGKIPSILSLFENIFYQAWQSTAINSLDGENRNTFYSEVLEKYVVLIGVGITGLLLIMKPTIERLFASDYRGAWIPAAILVVAVGIHALAGYIGALYTVFKKTEGALKTAAFGAVANIVLNVIAIPLLGMTGAAITTFIGYMVTLILRWKDIKKFATLKVNIKHLMPLACILITQFGLYYWDSPASYIVRTVICFAAIWIYRDVILSLLKRG